MTSPRAPKKLHKKDNHGQGPRKLPRRDYIEQLSFKRFGKRRPDIVVSIEERARLEADRKAARREARRLRSERAS